MDNYPPHIQPALDQIKAKLNEMLGKYKGHTADEVRESVQLQLNDFLRDACDVRMVYRSDLKTLRSVGCFVEWKAHSLVGAAPKTLRQRVVGGFRKTRVNIKRQYNNPNAVVLDVFYVPAAETHIDRNTLI